MAKMKTKQVKIDTPPPLPTNGIKFPEWIDDHPAVKMFQSMRLKDFAMICHFFGYLMIPQATLTQLLKIKKQAIHPTGRKEQCKIGQQRRKKSKGASKSGMTARKSK